MEYVYPNYYKDFACTMGDCAHNCCIGWEIDIDRDTAAYYRGLEGPFGDRLRRCISEDEQSHFILKENERCPFLNEANLCDIIIELGEESLCSVCELHPRFVNRLPERLETGLGLCCEAATRLILGKKEPVSLEVSGERKAEDQVLLLRDRVLELLQNREKDVGLRVEEMLSLCNTESPAEDLSKWCDILLKLERLDCKWTQVLEEARLVDPSPCLLSFDLYMKDRQTEYEQLAVYLIYRYFANSPDLDAVKTKARFTAFVLRLIYMLGAVAWSQTGRFTFEEQCELVRLFSSEIEYSEENLYTLFDIFDPLYETYI